MSKTDLYVKTKKNCVKNEIARQVLHEIQTLDPPGRFLIRAEDGMWREKGDAMTIFKIKNNLWHSGNPVKNERKNADSSTSEVTRTLEKTLKKMLKKQAPVDPG